MEQTIAIFAIPALLALFVNLDLNLNDSDSAMLSVIMIILEALP